MPQKKILFLDTVHPCLQQKLEALGYHCEINIKDPVREIEKIIHRFFGIVIRSRITLDKKILSHAKNLKFIARSGSGMESIDVNFAHKKGIFCINSPEGNRNAVAEHALGMLLNLFNNINRADKEIREGKWVREKNRGLELGGKTIGIIGYGNTGSAFTKLLQGFDVKILVYDKYKNLKETNPNEFGEVAIGNKKERKIFTSSLKDIFSEADVLSLHIPLTEETIYLVQEVFIKKFRKNFFLINTSRGPIVKTDDLVKNIKSGKIQGACLDVIEYEEGSFEEIGRGKLEDGRQKSEKGSWSGENGKWKMEDGKRESGKGSWNVEESFEFLKKSDKVILTPHIAGWTVESYRKLSEVLAEKIKEKFHGENEKE